MFDQIKTHEDLKLGKNDVALVFSENSLEVFWPKSVFDKLNEPTPIHAIVASVVRSLIARGDERFAELVRAEMRFMTEELPELIARSEQENRQNKR